MRVPLFFVGGLVALTGAAVAQEVGDPEQGATVFRKCMACHRVGVSAQNAIGPVLNGIVGRPAGTYADYSYSDANANSGVTWDVETLMEYLPAPREFLPGTKMTFAGLKNPQEVVDVIAYLAQFNEDGTKTEPTEEPPG